MPLEPLRRVHAVSDPSELLESLEFTWTFKALSERATRLDLALDFEMRSLEHAIMWDLAKNEILQKYIDSFKLTDMSRIEAEGLDKADLAKRIAELTESAVPPTSAAREHTSESETALLAVRARAARVSPRQRARPQRAPRPPPWRG